MKKIKVLSTAFLIGLSAIALGSCSKDETPTTAPATTGGTVTTATPTTTGGAATTATPTTTGGAATTTSPSSGGEIKFYNTCGDKLQAVIDIAIDTFETKYPGWTVTSTQIGGYDDVYNTCVTNLQANTQPDIAYCYSDHVAKYMQSGKVLDLNQYINSTGNVAGNPIGYTAEEIADFIPGYYNEGKATMYANYEKYGFTANSILTMPYSKSTELMYYNATALKEAGYVDAKGNAIVPTTWDELWDVANVLSEKYPTAMPLCYDSEANWVINMCMQNGWNYTSASEPYYLFKNDQNLANWMDQMYVKYEDELMFETQTTYGSYTSSLFTKGTDGGCIFCIGSSGGASYQATDAFEWGVAPIPGSTQADGKVNNSVISQGPSLVMFNTGSDEKQTMAWLFIKELLDPTYQAKFSMQSGYNPVRSSTYDIPDYEAFLENDENIISVAASVAKTLQNAFYTSPAFVGSADARIAIGAAFVYVIQGEKSASKALEDAYKTCGGK